MAAAIPRYVPLSIGAFAAGTYLAYQYTRMNQQSQDVQERGKPNNDDALDDNNKNNSGPYRPHIDHSNCKHMSYVNDPRRNEQYHRIADIYDDKIGWDEFFLGMNLIRRCLLYFHSKGTVLEVGAGTGRNLRYYPSSKVQRVLLTDNSDAMLSMAQNKIDKMQQRSWLSFSKSKTPKFVTMKADASDLKALPDNSFDTVVDTFGLCSYDDPAAVLREMARVCKKGSGNNSGGKILLLEHGRSKTWKFITNHLDFHAERHAASWGCVWNRDLDRIISDGGLVPDTLHRFHFGTTYYVVCRPKKMGSQEK